ncbi:MAG: DHH family phosphoesterase [Eubacterium sp.]
MKSKLGDGKLYFFIFILSLILVYFNPILGVVSVIFCGVVYYFDHQQDKDSTMRLKKAIENINDDIEKINQERMYELPISMVIVGSDGKILWYNQYFDRNFRKKEEGYSFFQKTIQNELGLNMELMFKKHEADFMYKNQEFTVVANDFNDGDDERLLLHFFDVTIQKKQQEIYQRNEPVFGYVLIDNYDDIIEQLPSHERSAVLSSIDLKLNNWAKQIGAFMLQYENDHYLMIFEKEKLVELEEERFHILDDIRETTTEEKAQVTLSIGIGVSDEPLAIKDADELSHTTLDIALARGGDQVVVRKDEKMAFYGGTTEATEKRTKVKARVKAHGLRELIRESDNVLIMGHQTPDMDCLGAAIGLLGACKAVGKTGKMVIKEINYSIKELFRYLMEDEEFTNSFIKPRETKKYINTNTLLIIVDTQNGNYLELPELADEIAKVVVIDHHRRSGKFIEKTLLSYAEAYASSTCELITELLQYFDEKEIVTETTANALMAGMCMDTKMFTFKTGVRTFEAASYLRRRGADTIIAKTLLQDDFVTYATRSEAVRNAKIHYENIAVSTMTDNTEYAKIIASQAADELLNIKGIKASFILLKTDEGLIISGRSMGEINVQVILEKIGGGGHLAIAGAQLPEVSDLEVGKQLLLDAIELYMKERE